MVYLTFVALYLLFSWTLSVASFTYSLNRAFEQIADYGFNRGLGGLFSLFGYAWLGLVMIPTLIGSVGLLRKSKVGVYASLVALAIITPTLPFTLAMVTNENEGGVTASDAFVLFPSFVSSVLVFLPLVLGWKRVSWQ